MLTRLSSEWVHEGKYAAKVAIDLIETEGGWSPYLSPADMHKLDRVRSALRRGDHAAAAQEAQVFELLPVFG